LLRPHSPKPDAPFLELFGPGLISAVMNRNSVTVAQQNDVRLLADDRIKPVHLVLGLNEYVGHGFPGNLQFDLTPPPRVRYFLGLGQQALPVDYRIDAVAVR
jgi:hypothetical protein